MRRHSCSRFAIVASAVWLSACVTQPHEDPPQQAPVEVAPPTEFPDPDDPFGGIHIGDSAELTPGMRQNDDGTIDWSKMPEFVPVGIDGIIVGFLRKDAVGWDGPHFVGDTAPQLFIYDRSLKVIGSMIDGAPVLTDEE